MESSDGHYLWVSRVLGGCCTPPAEHRAGRDLSRGDHSMAGKLSWHLQVFSLCPAWLERARITEEQVRTLSGPSPSQAGRAGCSGPCPGGF